MASGRTRVSTGSPHTFCKTGATLISGRVDTQTASQQLGHSSPAITRELDVSKPGIAGDVAHVLDELVAPDPEADSEWMLNSPFGFT